MAWASNAQSVLLDDPSATSHAYSVLTLPGGEVRQLDLRSPVITIPVAFVDGREIAFYDPTDGFRSPTGATQVSVTVIDIDNGASRVVPVVGPSSVQPGESLGILSLLHAGGNPASVWAQIGPTILCRPTHPKAF